MALVQAVLTYRPCGVGSDDSVPIAGTDDPRVLRVLREILLESAVAEAEMWRTVDPGLAAMKQAEVQRLAEILRVILPEEESKPGLRVVKDA
jgi:hypothetical protein